MKFLRKGRANWKYILIVFFVALVAGGGIFYLAKEYKVEYDNFSEKAGILCKQPEKIDNRENLSEVWQFRNQVISFVRKLAEAYFEEKEIQAPEELEIKGNWDLLITLYHKGKIKGEAEERDEILSLALEEATRAALEDEGFQDLTKEELLEARFLIRFKLPSEEFSFIGYKGEGKELIDDLVVIRELDKDLVYQKIKEGKEFLYRMEHKDEHGFYKKYDALNDELEPRLHTVYSASIIYTFLYAYDLEKDEEILKHIPDWGSFLLSMQNKDREDKRYGAFHYSYYFLTGEREKNFVVGTSALSIFTLLRLYELTSESKYLESAKLAGDWLTTMQNLDGTMKPYVKYSEGKWVFGKKESLLYEGQVLSSLSKLYGATGEKRYFDTAERIAQRFAQKYEKEQGYIQDEYREKNPISNSWVVMSLMDFYKVNPNNYYKNIVFELSEKVLENQKNDPEDLLEYGRWEGAYSTSGTGWISEVMAETYRFCKAQNRQDCEKYKTAIIKAIRWIIQHTYSEENAFYLKNPERAKGGSFWDKSNKYVRTDSVCHTLNGFIRIMDFLDEGVLLFVPEKSLELLWTR